MVLQHYNRTRQSIRNLKLDNFKKLFWQQLFVEALFRTHKKEDNFLKTFGQKISNALILENGLFTQFCNYSIYILQCKFLCSNVLPFCWRALLLWLLSYLLINRYRKFAAFILYTLHKDRCIHSIYNAVNILTINLVLS